MGTLDLRPEHGPLVPWGLDQQALEPGTRRDPMKYAKSSQTIRAHANAGIRKV